MINNPLHKTRRLFFPEKKLSLETSKVHPSHEHCYGRGYTALLGRALVPPRTSNCKGHNKGIQSK